MDNTQAETMIASMDWRDNSNETDISMPLQTLFDECLNFISVNDFNL
ncbi:hypothetical protein IJ541_05200 [bacterium]|nr:hypothetical protein [bacterium]